ncbi:MAG: hypothetical protein LPJ95_04910, partial [Paracoccaceae bacterium]|nr:hypothetical protein [Paracoccaceae bacterium]
QLALMPLADDQDRKLVLGAFGFAPEAMRRCKFKIARRREERLLGKPEPVQPAPTATPAPLPAPASRRFRHLTLVHAKD